jgi:hypothetical protein
LDAIHPEELPPDICRREGSARVTADRRVVVMVVQTSLANSVGGLRADARLNRAGSSSLPAMYSSNRSRRAAGGGRSVVTATHLNRVIKWSVA